MSPFTTHRGRVVPLARANVDTDVIIRMERCATEPRDQLGRWAFEALRYGPDGRLDPDCVFNRPAAADASILVAGPNFGCGSSREMAVWALAGMGLRCVIAPGFGDIFHANCFQNGLLPIRLPEAIVDDLLVRADVGPLDLAIDLAGQTVTIIAATGTSGGEDRTTGDAPAASIAFEIDPWRKAMLLQGLDEVSLSLTCEPAIARWQQADRAERPWVYQPFQLRTDR